MDSSLNFKSIENDQERINFLLSPSKNNNNSHSWNTKFQFWKSNIISHCTKNKILVFNFKKLAEMMAINSRLPQCLDAVVSHMLKEGTLKTLSDFRLACDQSWISWTATKFITRPLSWSLTRLVKDPLVSSFKWLTGAEEYNFNLYAAYQVKLPEEELVVPHLITATADEIHSRHTDQISHDFTDNIINYHIFRRSCRDIVAEEGSFELAIMDLCRRKLCRVVVNADGEKFLVMVDKTTSSSAMLGNEQKIYRLKMMEFKLEKEIEKLEGQINECKQNAKDLIKQGKKKMALTLLKKKKNLEDLIDKKHDSIEKVSSLMSTIQQTEHNKQMFDAFSSGVEAFKGLREKTGLSEEKVDETMMEVQEALEQHQEINQMISKPVDVHDWPDEDLEAELNDIIANQEAEKQIEDLSSLLDLPTVPTHEPSIPTPTKKPTRRSEKSF